MLAWGLVGTIILGAGGFGIWLATLPSDVVASPEPVPAAEAAAMIEQLRPPKRERPVIAVIGINDATETTDYLMPTGILRRADVADVYLVATAEGPVRLYPALTVKPDMTIAEFDAAYPEGADYAIVPAMSRDDDPEVMAWLQHQAARGSAIIGVCFGAKVVAAAGLLDGRKGTTHWFALREIVQKTPGLTYVPDRRIVVDGDIATTTGISASMPLALTLIEAIAGRAKAEGVAREIGLEHWDASHDSGAFKLTRPFATTVMGNILQFWDRDELGIPLEPGVDEVSLALVADAWSRTYRSKAVTFALSASPVTTANGFQILPDRAATDWPEERRVAIATDGEPANELDGTLQAIAARYGEATTRVVAMQLEYPKPDAAR
jgi:putative intracellular protease/amidase